MNSIPRRQHLPRETQPLTIRSNQTRFVTLYGCDMAEDTMTHIDKLFVGRSFRSVSIDAGRMSATEAVDQVASQLDKTGHLLLSIHGTNLPNARTDGHDRHHVKLPEGDASLIATEDLLRTLVDRLGVKPLKEGRSAHRLPFIYLFSYHAGALREQISPDSDLWKRANLMIFGGKRETHYMVSGNAMAGAIRYVDHCQRTMQTVDPMKLLYFAGMRRGECITLMGGELNAPLVWHAPKPGRGQSQTDNLEGKPEDLQRFAQAVSSLRPADTRLLPDASLTEVLFNRILRDDTDGVEDLLRAHIELLEMPSTQGTSPLIFAAEQRSVNCLEYMLECGADPDHQDADGETALIQSVCFASHRFECTQALLVHGADPNLSEKSKNTALMYACALGHVDAVRALLEYDADPDRQDSEGSTALMEAAVNPHGAEVVRLLLQQGADPDLCDQDGRTALIHASTYPHMNSIQALLEQGADPNLQDRFGHAALGYAANRNDVTSVNLLLAHGADPNLHFVGSDTPLLRACLRGFTTVASALLAGGAKPDQRLESGRTALTMACSYGHSDIVRLLLDSGASPDLQDDDGMTALMHAVEMNDLASTDWLLAKDARLDIVANDGRSCLAIAASDSHLAVLERLLESGQWVSAGLLKALVGEAREHQQVQAAELLQQALRRITATQ